MASLERKKNEGHICCGCISERSVTRNARGARIVEQVVFFLYGCVQHISAPFMASQFPSGAMSPFSLEAPLPAQCRCFQACATSAVPRLYRERKRERQRVNLFIIKKERGGVLSRSSEHPRWCTYYIYSQTRSSETPSNEQIRIPPQVPIGLNAFINSN